MDYTATVYETGETVTIRVAGPREGHFCYLTIPTNALAVVREAIVRAEDGAYDANPFV